MTASRRRYTTRFRHRCLRGDEGDSLLGSSDEIPSNRCWVKEYEPVEGSGLGDLLNDRVKSAASGIPSRCSPGTRPEPRRVLVTALSGGPDCDQKCDQRTPR